MMWKSASCYRVYQKYETVLHRLEWKFENKVIIILRSEVAEDYDVQECTVLQDVLKIFYGVTLFRVKVWK